MEPQPTTKRYRLPEAPVDQRKHTETLDTIIVQVATSTSKRLETS